MADYSTNHEELRRSNLLRLECQELINANIVDTESKNMKRARTFLHTVQTAISSLPLTQLDAKDFKEQENYNFKSDRFDKDNLIVDFNGAEIIMKPIDAFGAGIGLLKTSALLMDVCLVMPANWFTTDKDYLNFRYFDKRNLIALHLAKQLSHKKHRKHISVEVTHQSMDQHKLCLELRPVKIKSSFKIRLLLGTDGLIFPNFRYLPDRNNCRYNTNLYEKDDAISTPNYNAALAEDGCHLYFTNLVKEECSCRAYAEALVLLKIWQVQHDIVKEINFLLIILYMSQKKQLSKNMTPLQIFTLALKFLTNNLLQQANFLDTEEATNENNSVQYVEHFSYLVDKDKKVLIFNDAEELFEKEDVIDIYREKRIRLLCQQAYTISLMGAYNVLFRVELGQALQAYYAAKISLNKSEFREMFLTKFHFFNQYDFYLSVDVGKVDSNFVEYGHEAASRKILKVLNTALFARAKVIVASTGSKRLKIGIQLLNTTYNSHRVTRGPSGSSEHVDLAKRFKQFWGKKVELRRFGDGSVVHACVWQGSNPFDIVMDICTYIIKEHFNVKVAYPLKEMRYLVSSPTVDIADIVKKANLALESLTKFFKTADLEIPLKVAAVESNESALRYSNLYPPQKHAQLSKDSSFDDDGKVSGCTTYAPIIVNLKFDKSSKWPQEEAALKAAKLAFMIRIANHLPESFSHVNVLPSHFDFGYMGYSFRCLLNIEMEKSMQYHTMINAVHTRFMSSSSTLRLLQRWCAAHLLSGLISLEVLECIVCRVYCDFEVNSAVMGFIRCLEFFTTFNFARNPLIIDPNNQLSGENLSAINEKFEKARGESYIDGPSMYIVTPADEDSKPSIASPENVILSRLLSLSEMSLQHLLQYLKNNSTGNSWSKILRVSTSSFANYSVLLRVDPNAIYDKTCSSTDHLCSVDSFEKGLQSNAKGPSVLRQTLYKNIEQIDLLHGWQPVDEAMFKLRSRFGNLALFFYNQYMPEVICILWRPDAFKPVPFLAKYSEFKRPIDVTGWSTDTLVVTNYEEVMAEIKYICRDIVVDIKVQNDSFMQPKIDQNAQKKQKTANGSTMDTTSDDENDSSSEEEEGTSSSDEVLEDDESSDEETSDDE